MEWNTGGTSKGRDEGELSAQPLNKLVKSRLKLLSVRGHMSLCNYKVLLKIHQLTNSIIYALQSNI